MKFRQLKSPYDDKKFGDLLSRSEVIGDSLIKGGSHAINGNKVHDCARYFSSHTSSCGDKYFTPLSCNSKVCPRCARRRQIQMRERITSMIKDSSKFVRSNFVHMVLTKISTKNLYSRDYLKMREAFRRLIRSEEFEKSNGGFYAFEVTFNPEIEKWHLHLHVLISIPSWSDARNPDKRNSDNIKTLRRLWRKCYRDKRVWLVSYGKVKMKTVNQLVKYTLKPMSDENIKKFNTKIAQYANASKSIRMLNKFGDFYKIKYPEEVRTGTTNICRFCGDTSWDHWDHFSMFRTPVYEMLHFVDEVGEYYGLKPRGQPPLKVADLPSVPEPFQAPKRHDNQESIELGKFVYFSPN